MATFFVENFGCRATEADATALRNALLERGGTPCKEAARADFVVLNTCTVTAAADSQAREAIRRIHRASPNTRIVVTGCYAQRAPEEIAALEGVTWVVGNGRQQEIPGLVSGSVLPAALLSESVLPSPGAAKILSGDMLDAQMVQLAPMASRAADRTRPILKIQDGCNNRCAYCVIPFVRGRSRSLTPDAVVQEVRGLAAIGAKEIVLSGINLGSYGRDLTPRAELSSLIRRILDETPLEHLRFSSIEPQDVTEDLVALVAACDRLAPHFHVPLQSGSNRVLRAMHRWYRAEMYAERISVIRRRLPDAAIGADVIAGFPGETDEDFRQTVEFVSGLSLNYLHVFSFSARPGTKAESLDKTLPPEKIRERAQELRVLSGAKQEAFRRSQAGHTLRALTLGRQGENWTEALTRNYLKIRVAGRRPANEWQDVIVAPKEAELCSEADLNAGRLVLENHLGQSEVAAVSDRKGDVFHAHAVGELAGHAREI